MIRWRITAFGQLSPTPVALSSTSAASAGFPANQASSQRQLVFTFGILVRSISIAEIGDWLVEVQTAIVAEVCGCEVPSVGE